MITLTFSDLTPDAAEQLVRYHKKVQELNGGDFVPVLREELNTLMQLLENLKTDVTSIASIADPKALEQVQRLFGTELKINTPEDSTINPPGSETHETPYLYGGGISSDITEMPEHVHTVGPIAPPPPPVAHIECDARGIPWDKRIHARTQTKTKDNLWKPKRGINKDFLAMVEKELLNGHAIPAPTADIAPPPPVAPEAPPAILAGPGLTVRITQMIKDKKITIGRVLELLTMAGVKDIVELNKRPELVPQVSALLDLEGV
jgi:hypothetical protein